MNPKAPIWFGIVSAVGLIWNLMGIGAFVMQARMSDAEILEAYEQTQADIILAQPSWYPLVFGLAVFGGAVGCLGLLLRRKWAFFPLILSLLCVIIQNIYFGVSSVYEHVHGAHWSMTIMIPLIAVFLVWFARNMTSRGILR